MSHLKDTITNLSLQISIPQNQGYLAIITQPQIFPEKRILNRVGRLNLLFFVSEMDMII